MCQPVAGGDATRWRSCRTTALTLGGKLNESSDSILRNLRFSRIALLNRFLEGIETETIEYRSTLPHSGCFFHFGIANDLHLRR